MRILFVAMADSLHTARWVAQLRGTGWDVHMFPIAPSGGAHPLLADVTLHGVGLWRPAGLVASVRVAGLWPFRRGAYRVSRLTERLRGGRRERADELVDVIRRLKPDVVHSLEMQRAGYLTLEAKQKLGARFPPWVYSSWGSDIFLFGRRPDHAERVRAVLESCDYLVTDCRRDVGLAREFGFRGEVLGVFPGGGGYDVRAMQPLRAPGEVGARRAIAVKGYHNEEWGGRALLALQAVQLAAEAIRDYRVIVYSAVPEVEAVVAHMSRTGGVRICILPRGPHEEILKLMGNSRVALGVGVSDGTPNTMLEAMIMGALPIQSDTISTREWIEDGRNGLLVPPEEPEAIAAALRKAVREDSLVETAAETSSGIMREKVDVSVVRPAVLAMYESVRGKMKAQTGRICP